MSQDNAELTRKAVAALNESYATDDIAPWRRHVERWVDPDAVLEAGSDAFVEGEWRGQDGAIGFISNQMEVLEEMWIHLDDVIEVDNDRFVVEISFGGKARHTSLPVELHPFHAFRLRDGRVMEWRIFMTRAEALNSLGGG